MPPSISDSADFARWFLTVYAVTTIVVLACFLLAFWKKRSNWHTCRQLMYGTGIVSVVMLAAGVMIVDKNVGRGRQVPVHSAPGWSQHIGTVDGAVTRTQVPTEYARGGEVIDYGPQDSLITTERQRVIIRVNAVFRDGDQISYACEPRSTTKPNMEPVCYEASYTTSSTPILAWVLDGAALLMSAVVLIIAWQVVRRFGPPSPQQKSKAAEDDTPETEGT